MVLQEISQDQVSDFEIRIAAKMREARKIRGLTLKDVAIKCGTTPQTIQRIETANMTVSLTWVDKIAKALGAAPDTFFETISGRILEKADREIRRANDIRAAVAEMRSRIDHFLQDTEKNAG